MDGEGWVTAAVQRTDWGELKLIANLKTTAVNYGEFAARNSRVNECVEREGDRSAGCESSMKATRRDAQEVLHQFLRKFYCRIYIHRGATVGALCVAFIGLRINIEFTLFDKYYLHTSPGGKIM